MRKIAVVVSALAMLGVFAPAASATHSWGSFHWAREGNPFTLRLESNLTTTAWHAIALKSSADWNQSSVLDTPMADEMRTDNKRCRPSTGVVEVCNGRYGSTGWLGIAQVWTSGGHVVQATSKLNDTYLANGYTDTQRQHVLCQEVGHTFGLGHQSESGEDLDTCMDYAHDLSNPAPDSHDYAQLETIYNSHHESSAVKTTTATGKGSLKRLDEDLYVEDLGAGRKRYVWVLWKQPHIPHSPPNVG